MDQKWPSLALKPPWKLRGLDLSPYWPFLSLEAPPADGAADADWLMSSSFFFDASGMLTICSILYQSPSILSYRYRKSDTFREKYRIGIVSVSKFMNWKVSYQYQYRLFKVESISIGISITFFIHEYQIEYHAGIKKSGIEDLCRTFSNLSLIVWGH